MNPLTLRSVSRQVFAQTLKNQIIYIFRFKLSGGETINAFDIKRQRGCTWKRLRFENMTLHDHEFRVGVA